jgi:hypothetical protein
MLPFSILSLFASLSLGNVGLTGMPPAYSNGQPLEATTCYTVVGAKPSTIGTLNTLGRLEHDDKAEFKLISQKLHWDSSKELPAWYFESAEKVQIGSFQSEFERQVILHQGTVYLYTADADYKHSAQPAGRLTSWITTDGEAAATFPFLKTDKLHIQKCDFN